MYAYHILREGVHSSEMPFLYNVPIYRKERKVIRESRIFLLNERDLLQLRILRLLVHVRDRNSIKYSCNKQGKRKFIHGTVYQPATELILSTFCILKL